ncbi:MAG: CRTAC1 family protein, partial [bacterium]
DDAFYRGLGGGRFEDATRKAGLAGFGGRGLGVVATDADADGDPDIYVANDLDPNFLFRNKGDGTFEEIGAIAGCAYSEDGKEQSGMGIAVGDYDNDGAFDLFVTNFQNEPNALYDNEGPAFFFDRSTTSGLGPPSLPLLGWGTAFFDYDRDGWLDVFVANGHTESDIALVDQLATWKQRALLHRNRGDGTFALVGAGEAPELAVPRAGRGTAFGDLDDDGDVDIVVSGQLGPATVLENVAETRRRWIGFELDEIGAVVEVVAGGKTQLREVAAGGSYLSGNDRRCLFGLGDADQVQAVTLRSRGRTRALGALPVDRYHRIPPESR